MRELRKELWPYKVKVYETDSAHEIELWLGQRMGAFKNQWNAVYHHNGTDFYFRESGDATMFALRWA